MRKSVMIALVVSLIIAFVYPVVGEVVKLTVPTDSTWKALDIEQPGWTSIGYDDSWWEDVATGDKSIEEGRHIWYPGSIRPDIAYFRKTFDISGEEFISGQLYVGLPYAEGSVDLYLNDNNIGKISNGDREPAKIDILPYLILGKNVIAAKVETKRHGWALSATIRYRKSAGTPVA